MGPCGQCTTPKTIKANEITAGQYFKTALTQRKFRYAASIYHFKEGDTELLRGKILICLPGCGQIIVPENDDLYIP